MNICGNVIKKLKQSQGQVSDKEEFFNLSLAQLLSARATGAGGLGFDSRVGQIGSERQRLAPAVTFLRSCLAQALSRGDWPCHSLHTSA